MDHILVIDDDVAHRESLSYLLEKEQFSVVVAGDGDEGLRRFQEKRPNLVLLDLMLPKMPGEEVCRAIRAVADTPIIMVSARSSEIDKVVGLELGADDYVTKPYSSAELVARIRAVLRGTSRTYTDEVSDLLQAGHVRMNLIHHSVTVDGVITPFALKEFELLEALMVNAGRVLSRGQLADMVWGARHMEQGKSLDVLIKRIRLKIEKDPDNPQMVKTIRGLGYLLENR